jgi:hypothetical protein
MEAVWYEEESGNRAAGRSDEDDTNIRRWPSGKKKKTK